jgi:hypothetical protein
MAKRNSRAAQRSIFKKNVEKLQRAGLIGKVDFRKKASPATIRRLEKYKSVLAGHAAAVQAPDLATARRLRKQLGLSGTGKTVVVPREKRERITFQKSTGEIVSNRPGYNPGEKIKKTFSNTFPVKPPPGSDKRLYYTIPARTRGAGKLKRRTFGSFDEMLYYISKYEVSFEEIEDRIEIEEITRGDTADVARQRKIHDEREVARKRYARKKPKAKKKPRKKTAKPRRETTSIEDIRQSKLAPTTPRGRRR